MLLRSICQWLSRPVDKVLAGQHDAVPGAWHSEQNGSFAACIAWRSHFGFSRIAIETRCRRSISSEKSVKIVFSAGASYSENGVVLRRQCLGVRVAVADRFQSSPRKRARSRRPRRR